MADIARALARLAGALPPLRRADGRRRQGPARRSAAHAAVVVTDDYPAFFLPRMLAAAAGRARRAARSGRLEWPAAAARDRSRVHRPRSRSVRTCRRPCVRTSTTFPRTPLAGVPLPPAPAQARCLPGGQRATAHSSGPAGARGPAHRSRRRRRCRRGAAPTRRARLRLSSVTSSPRYPEDRRQPDDRRVERLSPYLHFGHISVHEIFGGDDARGLDAPEAGRERRRQARGMVGHRRAAEAFLDELVTWREIGYNFAAHRADHDRYELAARVGARDARGARRRSAAAPLRSRRSSSAPRRTIRSGTPRRRARARGAHAQLPAHAVGQEDSRVDAHAAGRARDHDPPEQQVRARRPRSQLLQRHLLVPRPLRSAVGTGAPDLRHGPLHEHREHREEAAGEGVPGPLVHRRRP